MFSRKSITFLSQSFLVIELIVCHKQVWSLKNFSSYELLGVVALSAEIYYSKITKALLSFTRSATKNSCVFDSIISYSYKLYYIYFLLIVKGKQYIEILFEKLIAPI